MSSENTPITDHEFKKAVSELPDDALFTVKKELENSLLKLRETNEILKSELPSASPEDKAIYEEALRDNQPVVESKAIRLEFLQSELKIRGLLQ